MQLRQQHFSKSHWISIIYIMCFAGIGGALYGYDIGVIAGALDFLQKDTHLSTSQLSIIVSAVLGGGALATLVSGVLADWVGRKKMILISAVIFMIGILVLINSTSYSGVLTGRLIQGVGVGIVTIIVPLYLVETLPSKFRGRGVTLFQCFLTAGIMLASLINLQFVESGNWQMMFAVALVPAGILFLGTLGLSESPRWLFKNNKLEKANKALLRCNDPDEAKLEMAEMRNLIEESTSKNQHSIFHKRYIIPFLIALGIACANQLTGINSLLQFSTYILKQSGLPSDFVSMLGTLGITFTNFLVTILAFFLIDKIGRKRLMCFGTAGMVISLFVLGMFSHFLSAGLTQGYLIILGLLAYIFCYAIGPGVIVWLALSEILPTAIRGNGMAACLFINSLISTVLASVFLQIADRWGYAADFWLCSFFTIFYFILVYKYLPESKEKTLEEIEEEFRQKYE